MGLPAAHIETFELLGFVTGNVSDDLAIRISIHLEKCPDCLSRAKGMAYLRQNFDQMWANWTPQAHRQAAEDRAVARAVEAAASGGTLAPHALDAVAQMLQRSTLRLKVMIDTVRHTAITASGILQESFEYSLAPAYAGIGSPQDNAMVEKLLRQGSDFLTDHNLSQAMARLEEAGKIDLRSAQTSKSTVSHKGKPYLAITADGVRGTVWVKCFHSAGPAPFLAVLFSGDEPESCQIAQFLPCEPGDFLLAEFLGVPDGFYDLVIGAVGKTNQDRNSDSLNP